MKSPFPGMDPYLEQHWGGVHTRLIVLAADQLQPQLPADLVADIEERVYVEAEEDERRRAIIPDVYVAERRSRSAKSRAAGHGSATAEPLIIQISEDSVTERYIKVVERSGQRRVITVVEFMSPANKLPGEGRRLYLQKRCDLRTAGVNIVEIDLTRDGKRELLVPQHRIRKAYRTTYQATVWRACDPGVLRVYAIPLRDKLPTIAIPLRRRDGEALLDLQRLIDQCYAKRPIDLEEYALPPEPPLEGADAKWAAHVLAEKHRS